MVRNSPGSAAIMTQQPVPNVNGTHQRLIDAQYVHTPTRPSRLFLENRSATSFRFKTQVFDENQEDDKFENAVDGTQTQNVAKQGEGKQVQDRLKAAPQLTNGVHEAPENVQRHQLVRSKTDYDRDVSSNTPEEDAEHNWQMRHGWEDQYNSEEYLHLLSSVSAL